MLDCILYKQECDLCNEKVDTYYESPNGDVYLCKPCFESSLDVESDIRVQDVLDWTLYDDNEVTP